MINSIHAARLHSAGADVVMLAHVRLDDRGQVHRSACQLERRPALDALASMQKAAPIQRDQD
jgi:hypothetical protein